METVISQLKEIGEFKIQSSTDVTMRVLSIIPQIFVKEERVERALQTLMSIVDYLVNNRPTSVMTLNTIGILIKRLEPHLFGKTPRETLIENVSTAVATIKKEIENSILVSASLGAKRIPDGSTLMTCSHSKAIKALFSKLKADGKKVHVYVTESRPGGEGQTTAQELSDMGFETELIVDSAARFFMKNTDYVVVGAEAIAANGAVVNKVGTSLLALAAHEARVRMFVLATTYKFSSETILGELVRLPIVRDTSLLLGLEKQKIVTGYPLFDVTPPRYIDAIITERGVVAPEAVLLLIRELYGWPAETTDTSSIIRNILKVVKNGGSS